MQRVDVPKTDSAAQTSGCWWIYMDKPVMRCPECDGIAGLDDHNIDPTGRVTPSLRCPQDGCEFHRHVTLLDWTPW